MSRRLPIVLAGFVAALVAAGCGRTGTAALPTRRVLDGDPGRGRRLVASGDYGCTACHTIPGIRTPRGVVGPPLGELARQPFIAGALPNTPDVLVAFLQDPPARLPQTGMPDVGLGAAQARDIAAYLYTLGSSEAR